MEFEKLSKTKTGITVKITGDISLEYRDELRQKFNLIKQELDSQKDKKTLQVDMSEVEYIDSVGISFFVKLKKELDKKNIQIDLLNVSKMIRQTFVMLALDNYFNFVNLKKVIK